MDRSKNSGKGPEISWRDHGIFVSCLLMLLSLLISRVALSVTSIIFVALCLLHRNVASHIKRFLQSPFLVLFSLLFFIPFVSGLWSMDAARWSDVVRIKLPLLFFPLAFAGRWKLSYKQWCWIAAIFLAIVSAGCLWSFAYYFQHIASVQDQYLKAKTLPTILENDHVRFSWLASVAAMLCLLFADVLAQKNAKRLVRFLFLFFAVYLHVLSARTGLLSLYFFLFIYIVWQLLKSKKPRWSIAAFCIVLCSPLLACWLLPTFQARVRYVLYDASFIQKNQYVPGSNDGARMLSLKAGWHVLRQHPFGAGAGDFMHETEGWYATHVPQVLATDKFYPCSEWLMYGGFAGWPGIILFTIIMLFPFSMLLKRYRVYWVAVNATAAFSFIFDIGLEVQYGVFLYAFIILCLWKWLQQEKQEPANFINR